MPKNLPKDVIGLFPRLNGLVDPAVDRELFLAFLRLYEYFSNTIETKVVEVKKETTVETQQLTEKTTQLINNFAAKLIKGNSNNQGNNPLETLGSGTVTSVAASGNLLFTISGSPITESGTFSFTLSNQSANKIFAGPTTGAAASPTFRALVKEDINIPFELTTETNADPTTAEYVANTWGVHHNTASGDIFIAFNDGGIIKKLLLV